MARPAKPTLAGSIAGMTAELGALREKIAALQARRDTLETAPPTLAEELERLDALIAREAASYQPRYAIGGLFSRGPGRELELVGAGPGNTFTRALCFLAPDTVRAAIRKAVEARHAELAGAGLVPVADAERVAELAKLAAELREAEQAEESIIVEAARHGITLERRGDLDPAIFLEVEEKAA